MIRRLSRLSVVGALVALPFFGTLSPAHAAPVATAPSITAEFLPDSIPSGEISTLTLTLEASASATENTMDLAFSATMPGDMEIASGGADTDCRGLLVADVGTNTIDFSGGGLPPSQSCTITVSVTTTATQTFTTSDLTSDQGTGGAAADTLTVLADISTITSSLSPAATTLGNVSRMIYSYNRPSGSFESFNLVGTLPDGVVLATPVNAVNGCGGSFNGTAGESSFSAFNSFAIPPASCTVEFDVFAAERGTFAIDTAFTGSASTNATLTATLTVAALPVGGVALEKFFSVSQAAAGETVALTFQLQNTSRTATATNLAFTDDLDGFLSGAVATGALPSDPCGSGSAISGTGLLSFSGGTLAPGDSCVFKIDVALPSGAAGANSYTNTSSALTGMLDSTPYTGGTASASLRVLGDNFAPVTLSKEFTDDPVAPGGTVAIDYVLTNPNSTQAASGISFVDNLTAPSGIIATVSPQCGGAMGFNADTGAVTFAGGSVPANDSCTITITAAVPDGTLAGDYESSTDPVSSTVNSAALSSAGASDTLQVSGGATLRLSKAFLDDQVATGAQTQIKFTIENDAESAATATAIAFTDDLDAFLTGTTLGATQSNTCNGSISGTSTLSYSGGSLAPDDSCEFVVNITAGTAATGTYTNTTSGLTAMAGGVATNAPAATDSISLFAGGVLGISKEFLQDPYISGSGSTATVRYIFDNTAGTLPYTALNFTEDFNAFASINLTGGLPAGGTCGAGSTFTAITSKFLLTQGVEVPAGGTCTLDFELTFGADPAAGSYGFTSGDISATQNGGAVALAKQSATLNVEDGSPLLSMVYETNPLRFGDTTVLEFTIINTLSAAIDTIAFTEDLDAQLSGLVATGLPVSACGGTLAGTSTLSLTGGSLAADASCSFSVTLQTPGSGTAGVYPGGTSGLTAQTVSGAQALTGDAASADLQVLAPASARFAKTISPDAVGPAGTTTISYTITNLDSGAALSDVQFSDDLNAALGGLVASGLPTGDICGSGSSLTGTSTVQLTNGSIAAGQSCSFNVTAQVPSAAAAGSYTSTTSALTSNGLTIGDPASDSFSVEPAPLFSQAVSPNAIAQGGETRITYTINNAAASIAAASLSFNNTYPALMTNAAAPNASTTCTGGTLTAAAGTGTLSYSGGTVSAGASCTVSVTVQASAASNQTNTSSALTSSLGNSGTSSAALAITAAPTPVFSVAFASSSVAVNDPIQMTWTIDNTGALVPATSLDFTNDLAVGLVIASTPNAATTCSGGTLTASANATQIRYTGGTVTPSQSCTVTVDVVATAGGTFGNTTGNLTSSLGTSGTANDSLNVPFMTLTTPLTADNIINGAEVGAVTLAGTTGLVENGRPVSIRITDSASVVHAFSATVSGNAWTTSSDLSALADGSASVSVTTSDANGAAAGPATTSFSKDTTPPTGHSTSFDAAFVNAANRTAGSFTFAAAEVGATFAYTITSSAGGAAVTGSGTIATATDQISGLDLSGLTDGTLTLSVVLTDVLGNAAAAVTDTVTKDTAAPTVAIDTLLAVDDQVNQSEAPAVVVSGTASGVEDGQVVAISITDSAPATLNRTATVTGGVWSVTVDMSGLADGALALTADVSDVAGNPAGQATTSLSKDTVAPTGHSAGFDASVINAANQTTGSFTFASAEVGATFAYTISSSAGGTAVTGNGTLATATDQVSGLDLSGLTDGTLTLSVVLTDSFGNAAAAVTNTVTKDVVAPSLAFDSPLATDDLIGQPEAAAVVVSGTASGVEDGQVVAISITDSAPATRNQTATVTGGIWSVTVDMSGFSDGALALTADVSDVAGNPAGQAISSLSKDTVAPTGHSAGFDASVINEANETAGSFTFADAEVGATFAYSISSSAGGTAVTGSGTIATATDQISGLDLSGLTDGTLTLSVVLTDSFGNAAAAVTDTATKDVAVPSLVFDTPLAADDLISQSEAAAVVVSGTASGVEDGQVVAITITDIAPATLNRTATVTGGVWSVTVDMSGLADGALALTADVSDVAGNTAVQATKGLSLDATVPVGFGAIFDQTVINASNQSATSFSFVGAELGATYAFTISSSAGGTDVTGSGTIATATDQISGIDLSGLNDGLLTLSVTLIDALNNASTAVTDTVAKDAAVPTLVFDSPLAGDDQISASEATAVVVSGTASGVEDGQGVVIAITDSAPATRNRTATVTGGIWSVTVDMSGFNDGALALTADVSDVAGNPAGQATKGLSLDTTVPAGFGAAFDQLVINASNQAAASFSFNAAEVGATYAFTISSSTGGTDVTGSGTIATATDQISGIDLSGLNDGTLTLSVTLTDALNNVSAAVTDTVIKDAAVPTLAFDAPLAGDDMISGAEASAFVISGTASGIEDGRTVLVSITDSATGVRSVTTPVTGGVWTLTLDISGLGDGALALTADASDAAGNPAAQATASLLMDTTAPTGHTVAFDAPSINDVNQAAASFSFAGAEVGATFAYTISSTSGTDVTGTGNIATGTDQITGLDVSGLADGTLTLTVVLTDTLGNTAAAVTDTVVKDAGVPLVGIASGIAGDEIVNAAEQGAVAISGTATGVEDGQLVTVVVMDSASAAVQGTAPVSGATYNVPLDLGALAEGALTVTADVSDVAGNAAAQATSALGKDTNAPSGHSIAFDQPGVSFANQAAIDLTLAGAEVGSDYVLTITSSGGGTTVSRSGTVAAANEPLTGFDLSGLADGTLTASVVLTDGAGNAASAATATSTKETTVPTVTLTAPAGPLSDAFEVSVDFSEPVTGLAIAGFDIVGATATGLTGGDASYILTVLPDFDGEISVQALANAAQDGQGNPSDPSDPVTVTAHLTGTPNPVPPADSDGDGIPDIYESASADRDGDGIPDASDYDPAGYFYCEDDGRILTGGGITVSGPSGSNSSVGIANDINIVQDGSTGHYQWFALRPGTYSVTYHYPTDAGLASTARLSSGSLDVTTLLPANPAVLGSTEFGNSGSLADSSLAANPVFYSSFVIAAGDPNVLANNIPMTQCAENAVIVSAVDNGAEANGATTDGIAFTISQDRLSALDTVVSYTMSGTATEGTDYVAASGSLTIPAGDMSMDVDLDVLEDGLVEGVELATLTLTAITSADEATILSTTSSNLAGSASIADDDSIGIAVTDDDLTASENGRDTAAMGFSLLGQPGFDVVLNFAGDDQCSVSPASLTFTASNYASPQRLKIEARDDEDVEGTHSCQPTVTVASSDSNFNNYRLALSAVVVSDDLVDQIRDPLTQILKDDLEETIRSQQRTFSRIAKGALGRLRDGREDLPCGVISDPDVDGNLNITDANGTTQGKFGWENYDCQTTRRNILDGSFSVTWSEDTGTQAMLQMSRLSEKYISDRELRGFFWGGYYSRNNVDSTAKGTIDGYGLNGGVYGAKATGTGLFVDYYASAAMGIHNYDLTFDADPADIDATGSYNYAALFGGIALSGTQDFESYSISPRVGLDVAQAWVSDADVTAKQLGQTDTGRIDLPDFSGGRFFAEIEFAGLSTQQGVSELGQMMTEISLTPRLACEYSSYGTDPECGAGINLQVATDDANENLSYGFELDYERMDDLNRFRLSFSRERRFAGENGAVVTRLSMPDDTNVTVEHGVKLNF